jgi:hypothetical protein
LDDERVVAQRLQKKQWEHSAEVSEVATLSDEVKTLTEGLSGMLGVLKKLQQKVDAQHITTPSPSVVATVAAWSGEISDGGAEINTTRGNADSNHSSRSLASASPLRGGTRSRRSDTQSAPQHEATRSHHHKARRHRRHHKKSHVKVADVQHMMRSQGGADIESVSTSLNELDEMDAEASELEVASAGAASEGYGGDRLEVGGLDDGTSALGADW